MARSPTEPDHVATSTSVTPDQGQGQSQGQHASEDVNQAVLFARRMPPSAPHRQPSSLLSRYLAPTYEEDEQEEAAAAAPTGGSNSYDHPEARATDSSLARHHSYSARPYRLSPDHEAAPNNNNNMAVTMSPQSAPLPSLGPSPNFSSRYDMSDMRHVNALLKSHREFLNSRGRGTSLERTHRERRVYALPLETSPSASNPGDTGIPHSTTPPSPDSLSTISDNPPTDGVRARYRSWRETPTAISSEKAWSIGEESGGDVSEGQVEKSIAEALAGVEHNNRSRKASHSLRFFREGLPEERLKKREPKDKGHVKDKHANGKEGGMSSEMGHGATARIEFHDGESQTGHGNDDRPDLSRKVSGTSSNAVSGSSVRPSPSENDHRAQPPPRTLPKQLLDDLRKRHNLTPASTKGHSFSKSIPVTESEKLRPPKPREPSESSTAVDETGKQISQERHASDDEESSEEQISSALFVPHQTSARDSRGQRTQEVEETGESKTHERRDSSVEPELEPEQWLIEHEISPKEKANVAARRDVLHERPPAAYEEIVKAQEPETPQSISAAESGSDAASDTGYTTKGEESGHNDDLENTPKAAKPGNYMAKHHKDTLHQHQHDAKAPPEAIELIPYRHQVGGHTTMWRFSKRAVCKQLNNRENEFYEKVEHHHPGLLKFMPRYIGVLNVTFEKQQKRKMNVKEDGDAVKDAAVNREKNGEFGVEAVTTSKGLGGDPASAKEETTTRLISQSINNSQAPAPTVTFADNRHIIPKSFLQSPLQTPDSKWGYYHNDAVFNGNTGSGQSQPPLPNSEFTFRPTLSDKHAVSWGATTVNRQLRYEVFGEAFGQPVPIQRHRKPGHHHHHHRGLTSRAGNPNLRISHSESNLATRQQRLHDGQTTLETPEESMRKRAMRGAAERHSLSMTPSKPNPGVAKSSTLLPIADDGTATDFQGQAGTSAPEAEINAEPLKIKRKRRFSSGGLRRKPAEVDDSRGHLQYYEEADDAGYKGDGEDDVFKMDPEPTNRTALALSDVPPSDPAVQSSEEVHKESNGTGTMLPASRTSPSTETAPLLRPVNPNQARTQPDKRVEYFLLLEDLTAGMKRPCIMDLKMGTRQYGVDANAKKQASQRGKCAETTSRELGVRVCGLQVWDTNSQSYVFQDKYFGRSLKAGKEFQDALKRFLWDGQEGLAGDESVMRHIPIILKKLRQLEVLVKNLVDYRFYAASLLMFYDGDAENNDATTEAEVTDTETGKKKELVKRGREIDFKMADFANCITAEHKPLIERECPPQHPGAPDRGFLRGLRSLRAYFLRIQKEILEQGRVDISNDAVRLSSEAEGEEDLGELSY